MSRNFDAAHSKRPLAPTSQYFGCFRYSVRLQTHRERDADPNSTHTGETREQARASDLLSTHSGNPAYCLRTENKRRAIWSYENKPRSVEEI